MPRPGKAFRQAAAINAAMHRRYGHFEADWRRDRAARARKIAEIHCPRLAAGEDPMTVIRDQDEATTKMERECDQEWAARWAAEQRGRRR